MSSDFYKKILDNNKKWVENQLALDPEYFKFQLLQILNLIIQNILKIWQKDNNLPYYG